jgi:hypothetical protein
MNRKISLIFLLVALSCISASIVEGCALNYTPSVDIGDELIYKGESYQEGYTEEGIMDKHFEKYLITRIEDQDNFTTIFANISESEDNKNYSQIINDYPLAVLADYRVEPQYLISTILLVPGTRIFDYVIEIYEYFNGECNITKIQNGYGITLEYVHYDLGPIRNTVIYNQDGILEVLEFRYADLFDDGEYFGNYHLFSINGKRYDIPGFPWYLILIFTFVSILGIFLKVKKRKSLFIR